MAVTMAWKVYGTLGHRQRESFFPSHTNDFSEDGKTRIIEVENSDKTGTNDYSLVRITADTAEECERELQGQLGDGIFESSRTGRVEITEGILNKKELIEKLYGHLGIPASDVENDIAHDYLTDNEGRDGKLYIWYMDENRCAAVDADGTIVDDEEKLKELFC